MQVLGAICGQAGDTDDAGARLERVEVGLGKGDCVVMRCLARDVIDNNVFLQV